MVPFLQAAVGAIVWTLANAVYVDMRRRGVHGFGRFAAFWVGFPVTFLWMARVKEGRPLPVGPSQGHAEDDEDELLREVRRDRAARAAGGEGGDGRTAEH
jgi:hypothetical protein